MHTEASTGAQSLCSGAGRKQLWRLHFRLGPQQMELRNMASIKVTPLQDDLPFGARISGVTWGNVEDEAVRKQINHVFEDRGMIVFEDVEPSSKMQVAISTIFGPLKDHPVKTVPRVDQDAMPGVIEMKPDPKKACIVEVDGQLRMSWQPYHFDHC
jgi:taurine dioxygenase